MEDTPDLAYKMLCKAFKTVDQDSINVILIVVGVIGLLEESHKVEHASLQLNNRVEDLPRHELDSWKVERVAHWKVNSELEDATLVRPLVDKNYTVPALGHLEVNSVDLWGIANPWCQVHPRRQVQKLRVTAYK